MQAALNAYKSNKMKREEQLTMPETMHMPCI